MNQPETHLFSAENLGSRKEITVVLKALETRLNALDQTRDVQDVRHTLADVFSDLDHPAGKDNARLAIKEIREKLQLLESGHSLRSYQPRYFGYSSAAITF
ncbi:hypothetical protein JXD20_02250 [Candidatus Peregrinibacteria bacterium]|nr:hypothetical protein [Candidatus Peregrinibacteria bacterium]